MIASQDASPPPAQPAQPPPTENEYEHVVRSHSSPVSQSSFAATLTMPSPHIGG